MSSTDANVSRIVAEGIAIARRPGTDRLCLFVPQVCVLDSGRWLVSARASITKSMLPGQRPVLTCSTDQGATWSEPTEPWDPKPHEGRAGNFRAAGLTSLGGRAVMAVLMWIDQSQPELPFFNETTEGLLDCQMFVSRSEDEGQTWSEPRWINPAPYQCPVPTTGPMLRFPDGEVAIQFELNKHYEDTTPWHHASVLMFYPDANLKSSRVSVAAEDPSNRMYWWDQRPSVLHDGSVFNVYWSFDRQTARYINIHCNRSTDRGRSWSQLHDTGVPGQPAPVVPLQDGRLVMVYVDRTEAGAICARVSSDGGVTWPASTMVTIYNRKGQFQTTDKTSMQDAWTEMGKFALGLPYTAALPDGDVLVVYYAGEVSDKTDIRWARLRF